MEMRHPLTGDRITVALIDVVVLRDILGSMDVVKDWKEIQKVLHRWHWDRKTLVSIVNILSVALHALFAAIVAFSQMFFLHFSRRRTIKCYKRGVSNTSNVTVNVPMDPYLSSPGSFFCYHSKSDPVS